MTGSPGSCTTVSEFPISSGREPLSSFWTQASILRKSGFRERRKPVLPNPEPLDRRFLTEASQPKTSPTPGIPSRGFSTRASRLGVPDWGFPTRSSQPGLLECWKCTFHRHGVHSTKRTIRPQRESEITLRTNSSQLQTQHLSAFWLQNCV